MSLYEKWNNITGDWVENYKTSTRTVTDMWLKYESSVSHIYFLQSTIMSCNVVEKFYPCICEVQMSYFVTSYKQMSDSFQWYLTGFYKFRQSPEGQKCIKIEIFDRHLLFSAMILEIWPLWNHIGIAPNDCTLKVRNSTEFWSGVNQSLPILVQNRASEKYRQMSL